MTKPRQPRTHPFWAASHQLMAVHGSSAFQGRILEPAACGAAAPRSRGQPCRTGASMARRWLSTREERMNN